MSEPRFFGNVFRDAERNTENNEMPMTTAKTGVSR